jgi:hypothetical protein
LIGGWTKKQFPCKANSGYDRRTAQNEFGIYRFDLAEVFAVCRAAAPASAEPSSIPDPFPFALRSNLYK